MDDTQSVVIFVKVDCHGLRIHAVKLTQVCGSLGLVVVSEQRHDNQGFIIVAEKKAFPENSLDYEACLFINRARVTVVNLYVGQSRCA